VAGEAGLEIAKERFAEFPEAGELFVMRMLSVANQIRITDLDLVKVREYLRITLDSSSLNKGSRNPKPR